MTKIRLGDQDMDVGTDEAFQAGLRTHYENHRTVAPLCLCNVVRPRLYIARVGDRYILKRWPGSGHEHAVDCDRYEPPLESSGLGHLLGSAIREDILTGDIEIKLGFPLKKQPRQAPQSAVETDECTDDDDTGKASTAKAGLRATLHCLWDQAELTHWKPGMKGKRNWWIVRSRLMDAASRMTTKGLRFDRRLFIPEAFRLEAKDEIRLRRRAFLQTVASAKAARDLMLFLFEVKDIAPSTYGYKIVARNMPDELVYLSEETHTRMRKRFDTELEMFMRASAGGHLVAFGTLSVKPSGVTTIEDMLLMYTSAEWIPVGDDTEAVVVDYAVASGRAFVKPLKYNMGRGRALAAIVLTDSPEKPTALHIVRPDETEAGAKAREDLLQSTATRSVVWRIADDPVPSAVLDGIAQKGNDRRI